MKMKIKVTSSLVLFIFLYFQHKQGVISFYLERSSQSIECPIIPSLGTLDRSRFSGKWYVSWIITLPDGSPAPRCGSEIITELPGGEMNVFTKFRDIDGHIFYRNGKLVPVNSPSQFILLYPGDQFKHEYRIISTNYDDFAIVYSCNRIDDLLTVGKYC